MESFYSFCFLLTTIEGGGAFQDGANFMYPGYFVAERDVAVVTVNYRLGIMGTPFWIFYDHCC